MPRTLSRSRTALSGLVLGSVLISSAMIGAAPQAGAAAPEVAVPRLAWSSCGPGLEDFDCATVEVPTDYDRPRGATTTIALTRLPAGDPAQRIGSIFVNPGGPGGSGVDSVQQGAKFIVPAEVRLRFDIVGFDPRGVARSDPTTCYPTEAAEKAALADDLIFPVTPAEERRFRSESREVAANCAATSPRRFRHTSTANIARDLDLLRRAVGDDKLTYTGLSYGTYIGATYARLFPDKVRALLLDGTIDPREYSGSRSRDRFTPIGARIEQGRGGAEVFAEFHRRCAAAGPARCSLAALGDPATVARQTLDRLKRQPVQLPLPDGTTLTVTYQLAVARTFSGLYNAAGWADLADLWTALATSGRARRSVPAGVAELLASRRGEDYRSFGTFIGSTCVDATEPPPRVYPAVADVQDRRFPDFGRYRTWIDLPCHYFERFGLADSDAYLGPWQQTTNARVLVFGTRWDPATPYRNTRPYTDLFPRASLVTLDGWGHVAIGQSRCIAEVLTGYLIDPTRPVADATCPTDVVPFAASPLADGRKALLRQFSS